MNDLEKNRETVLGLETVSMDKSRLEQQFHKQIDSEYMSTPTNDRFVVTQKQSRGKAAFPLILITSNIESDEFKTALRNSLAKCATVGETVTIMYTLGGKAVFLCETKANKETIRVLRNFCMPFKFYEAKGKVKEDLSFDELIDIESIGKNIIPTEEGVEDYTPEVKKEVVANVERSKYLEDIENILKRGKSSNDIRRLINPEPTPNIKPPAEVNPEPKPAPIPEPQNLEKTEKIITPQPVPVPVEEKPIKAVKAW